MLPNSTRPVRSSLAGFYVHLNFHIVWTERDYPSGQRRLMRITPIDGLSGPLAEGISLLDGFFVKLCQLAGQLHKLRIVRSQDVCVLVCQPVEAVRHALRRLGRQQPKTDFL